MEQIDRVRGLESMSGRISVAPCGHTGETIIGNYVKCLVGCDGKPAASARGEVGHVPGCTCVPCQIRRRTTKIVLRTREGKDFAVIPWDGVSDSIEFTPSNHGFVTNYRFLDKDDKVVAQGAISDTFLDSGYKAVIKTKLFIDACVKMGVCNGGIGYPLPTPAKVPSRTLPTMSLTWPTHGTAFGGPAVKAGAVMPSGPLTKSSIRTAMLSILDLEDCEVDDLSQPGTVTVKITKFSDYTYNTSSWQAYMKQVVQEAADWLTQNAPVGVAIKVVNYSPMYLLDWAVKDFEFQYKQKVFSLNSGVTFVANALNGKLPTGALSTLSMSHSGSRVEFQIQVDGRKFFAAMTP